MPRLATRHLVAKVNIHPDLLRVTHPRLIPNTTLEDMWLWQQSEPPLPPRLLIIMILTVRTSMTLSTALQLNRRATFLSVDMSVLLRPRPLLEQRLLIIMILILALRTSMTLAITPHLPPREWPHRAVHLLM
jgi:hypothetical protein